MRLALVLARNQYRWQVGFRKDIQTKSRLENKGEGQFDQLGSARAGHLAQIIPGLLAAKVLNLD